MKSRSKHAPAPAQANPQADPNSLKPKRSTRTYTAADRQAAKALFISGLPQDDVAARLNIPPGTISAWSAKEGWQKAKECALEPLAAVATNHLHDILEKWHSNATKAVSFQGELCAQGDPNSLKELDQLCRATSSNIAAAFKLFRLDAQQPPDADSPMRRIRPVQVIEVISSTSPVEQAPSQVQHNPDGTPK